MNEAIEVPPMDEYNEALVANVHPPDWVNPTPDGRYNMVVIGAGAAGLITAVGAAGIGAKVAIIERHLIGGDCLNVGCVPSKCIIRSARVAAELKNAADYGVRVSGGVEVDFPAVMERMRRIRSKISFHDSAARFRDMGMDIFLGDAKFTSSGAVDVDGVELKFSKAVIAAGARAYHPPVEGLEDAGFHTNETIFTLTERPGRLAVIGGGPLGCEMAQAFRRLGSDVTVIEKREQILTREDPDAAAIIQDAFREDGINILLNTTIDKVSLEPGGKKIHLVTDGNGGSLVVDEILVGTGRVPNVENLGLERVGVEYDERNGVHVDDFLRTANPRIYAAGDVCLKQKFTHTADASARIVIQNALFWGRRRYSRLVIPWCTYTDPEIAHVGMYEYDAEAKGIDVDTYVRKFEDVDRAIADGEESGLVKVVVKKGTDKILGATIVAGHAGEMISEVSVAIAAGFRLGSLAGVIHPYPTQAEGIKQAADAYNRTRLTPFLKKIFTRLLALRR